MLAVFVSSWSSQGGLNFAAIQPLGGLGVDLRFLQDLLSDGKVHKRFSLKKDVMERMLKLS